ncbi:YncE family protein [Olivibacter sitiensis]|uniref:YncE family protein n=1 Tax=Olivibacter sitiensis TaxID=376470 RepID=UPI0003FB35F5|nr:DUF5074 domain-containing protein [Olivibacter sitiensis]
MRKIDKLSGLIGIGLLLLSACSKDPVIEPEEPIQSVDGVYVLNEGGFTQNNASISYYDFVSATFTSNAFLAANASGDALGDVANDAVIYGSKMYVVVNNSNKVEVLDAQTLQRKSGGIVRINQPRFLVCTEGKVFVSSYDDHVYVLDTVAYQIEQKIAVGRDPEMMVALNDKIYVANSGGVSEVYDNRIFIIDAKTYEVNGTIAVADNLTGLYAGVNNTLYAKSLDVYDAGWNVIAPAKFMVVDIASRQVSKTFDFQVEQFAAKDGVAYIYSSDYADEPRVIALDMTSNDVENENALNLTGVSDFVYSIGIDPSNGEIWLGDAVSYGSTGKVFHYANDGQQVKQSFNTGYYPKKFVFKNAN